MDSKVIEKIQKLFALANSNPSEEEAIAAALKAQQLMAKHKISMSDVDVLLASASEEKINITRYDCGPGLAWKFMLATIVAKNFRCKTFSYGRRIIAFYGHETDAEIAREVFEFLFKAGHRLANKEVYRRTKERGTATGVYNSFCQGFMTGIKEELGRQCKALMLVVPPKVTEKFNTYSADFKARKDRGLTGFGSFDCASYNTGREEGARIMKKKELPHGVA